MCNDVHDTRRMLIITSVAELKNLSEHCDVNDGQPHYHTIKVENQRRETVRVKGRSNAKIVEFNPCTTSTNEWHANFTAAGKQHTRERAQTSVPRTSALHDGITTEFEYSFDDPFQAAEPPERLHIQVNL